MTVFNHFIYEYLKVSHKSNNIFEKEIKGNEKVHGRMNDCEEESISTW